MKKIILISILALISFLGFSQTDALYHNIQVNEKVTFQGDTLNSCYLKITLVSINQVSSLSAYYKVSVYETKQKYEANRNWTVQVAEIPNEVIIQFSADFNQGDLFTKISNELKLKLLELNPTWNSNNLIIE